MNKFKENCEAHSNSKYSNFLFQYRDYPLGSEAFIFDVITLKAYRRWILVIIGGGESYGIINSRADLQQYTNLRYRYEPYE